MWCREVALLAARVCMSTAHEIGNGRAYVHSSCVLRGSMWCREVAHLAARVCVRTEHEIGNGRAFAHGSCVFIGSMWCRVVASLSAGVGMSTRSAMGAHFSMADCGLSGSMSRYEYDGADEHYCLPGNAKASRSWWLEPASSPDKRRRSAGRKAGAEGRRSRGAPEAPREQSPLAADLLPYLRATND